jgi:cell shape-determining protein MreC
VINTKIPKYTIVALLLIICTLPFRNFIEGAFLFFSRRLIVTGPYSYQLKFQEAKRQNLGLIMQIRRLRYLQTENERLRKALQFKEAHAADLIEANIISFNPSSWRRIVNVDIGKRAGVKDGLLAVNEEGYFVGKLGEVRNSYSRLILADDVDCSIPVFIGESSYGLLKGGLKGAKVFYVEAEDKIEMGQKVWIKLSSLSFPIYVGRVIKASKDSEGLFWDINVELSAGNPLLGEIFILK